MIFTSKVKGHDPIILEGAIKAKQLEDGSYESINSLLKRFKKSVQKSSKLVEYKRHEYYESPSVKKKRKHEKALKALNKKKKKADYYNSLY